MDKQSKMEQLECVSGKLNDIFTNTFDITLIILCPISQGVIKSMELYLPIGDLFPKYPCSHVHLTRAFILKQFHIETVFISQHIIKSETSTNP